MKERVEDQQKEIISSEENTVEREAQPSWLERIRGKVASLLRNRERESGITSELDQEELSHVEEETTLIDVASDVAQEEVASAKGAEEARQRSEDRYENVVVEGLRVKYGIEKIGKSAKDAKEILEAKNPLEYIAAVRIMRHLPTIRDGRLFMETPMEATDGKIDRATLHFTLNERVTLQNAGGNWEDVPYAMFMPADKAVQENGLPYGFGNSDTYWLMEKGLVLPEGTAIAYRKGSKDPRLEELRKTVAGLGLKVQFVEAKNFDDDKETNQILTALGYRNYGQTLPDDELKKRLGVRGSSQHNLTPVSDVEKVFLGGHPDAVQEEQDWNRKKRAVGYTPADLLRALEQNKDHFPEGVHDRYEQEAIKRLTLVMNDLALAKELFTVHFEKRVSHERAGEIIKRDGIGDPARKTEMEMYRDLAVHLFENSGEYIKSFTSRHEEVADSIMRRLISEMGGNASSALEEELAQNWEGIPEEWRPQVFARFMEVGGIGAVQLLENPKALLSDEEKTRLVEAVKISAPTIESRFGSKREFEEQLLGYITSDDGQKWYENRYGKEFVNYFLSRKEHGQK